MNNLNAIFNIPELRKRLFYTIIVLGLFRVGGHIPISGVDLQAIHNLFNQGGVLGFFNLFSGGAMSRFSIFALGILPYINASIIMQLLTIIWPQLKELSEEGESGRKQVAQYTRYLAIALALFQAIVMTVGFKSFLLPNVSTVFFLVYSVVSLVAGAALVMWLGELITDNGIGNGASLLIFVGIIAEMPTYIKNTYILLQGGASPVGVIILCLVLVLMIISIVYVQEAERKVQVQYAKKVVGSRSGSTKSTYIPFRLIQGGVMPIIFASAVLQFPLMFSNYIPIESVQNFFSVYYRYDGLLYNGLFCVLIFFFAFFYTALTFNPEDLAENIRKYGGFVLGIRPGKPTVEYLDTVITRLTLIGATFLALVALVPIVTATATQVTSFMGLGGTALLIMVGVAMDLVKQIESFVIAKKYEGLL